MTARVAAPPTGAVTALSLPASAIVGNTATVAATAERRTLFVIILLLSSARPPDCKVRDPLQVPSESVPCRPAGRPPARGAPDVMRFTSDARSTRGGKE